MENKLQVFENEQFGKVRVQTEGDKIFFCLKDVCSMLELSNPSKVKQQIEEEFGNDLTISYPIVDALNREQKATFVSEEQLYFCIFRSKKSEAKKFRLWIFNEVIPSIRKNGGYINGQEEMSPELIMAKAIIVANNVIEEQKKQLELKQKELDNKDKINYMLNEIIEENKPKVEAFDLLMDVKDTISIRDFIRHTKHIHSMKEADMFKYLCKKKLIFKDYKGNYQPYSSSITKGIMETKVDSYYIGGTNRLDYRAAITTKGIDYITKLIIKDFSL